MTTTLFDIKMLITGGTGFLGSKLVKHFTNQGYKILVPVRDKYKLGYLDGFTTGLINYVKLEDDYSNIDTILESNNINCIIHCASVSRGGEDFSNINAMIKCNILYPSLLLHSLQNVNNAIYINIGSNWQNVHEQHSNPFNFYASTKNCAEEIIKPYLKKIRGSSLRLYDTFGTGDKRNKILDIIINSSKSNTTVKLSPGHQLINLVSTNSIAKTVESELEILQNSKFNNLRITEVVGKSPMSILDLSKTVESITGLNNNIEWGGRDYRENEIMTPKPTYKIHPYCASFPDFIYELAEYLKK